MHRLGATFEGQSILVAGGTGGLGRAVSLAFLEAGADVAATYRKDEEYRALEQDALAFCSRRASHPVSNDDHAARLQVDKELLALQRRFRKVVARDYVGAPARYSAAQAIDRCLVFRQGISPKLTPATDAGDSERP